MGKRMLRWVLFFILVGIFMSTEIKVTKAEDIQKPSIEGQLSEILTTQKNILQRLFVIESKQTAITNALRVLGAAAGPSAGPSAPAWPPQEDLNKEYKIDMGHSSLNGNKNAKVTIVEFSDFQCPYSQRFHPAIPEVLKVYSKDVNYMLKNFPLSFHPQAKPAAKASLAAREQGKYWEMVELLFQNGKDLSEEKFKELAKQAGLNVDKFMKDYKEKDAEWEKLIAEDMSVANSSDVRGTPTFFINGKKTNARDLTGFKQEIDNILKK